MSFFNELFNKEVNNTKKLNSIKIRDSKYFNELLELEENHIPPNGYANSLQAELLRELWKLVDEAQRNGNINWDSDFSLFCDILSENISKFNSLSDDTKKDLQSRIDEIRQTGEYAKKMDAGNQEVEVPVVTEDYFYVPLFDAIGEFWHNNKELIAFTPPANYNGR